VERGVNGRRGLEFFVVVVSSGGPFFETDMFKKGERWGTVIDTICKRESVMIPPTAMIQTLIFFSPSPTCSPLAISLPDYYLPSLCSLFIY
jgi:hypothetical protein